MTWLASVLAGEAAVPADAVVGEVVAVMESVVDTVEGLAVAEHVRFVEMLEASIDASGLAYRLVVVGRAEAVVEDIEIARADQVDGLDVRRQAYLGPRGDCKLRDWAYMRNHWPYFHHG